MFVFVYIQLLQIRLIFTAHLNREAICVIRDEETSQQAACSAQSVY